MAVDLSFLPDQQVKKKVDLSFLPDQPTGKVDLSFLPDQPKPGLLDGITAAARSVPNPFTAPLKAATNVARGTQDLVRGLREVPLETAAPLFSSARQGDIPVVSEIFPQTRGIVPPALRPLTTGVAAPIDAFVGAERIGTDMLFGALGEDPGVSVGDRAKRALTEDRFLASRAIRGAAESLQPLVDKAIAEGVDPKLVHGALVAGGTALGTAVDIFTGDMIVRAIRAPGQVARAVRVGAERQERLLSALQTRAQQRFERAQREFNKQGGDPNQLRLPSPEPGARPRVSPAQPQQGPIAGAGFVIDQPGFKREVSGPLIQDVREVPGRAAPISVRPLGAPRAVGDTIDVALPLKRKPSREARMRQAAEEPMRKQIVERSIERAGIPQEQFPFLPKPEAPRIAPLPEQVKMPKAGKGFIVEPGGEPILPVKAPRVRENIIEKSAKKGPTKVATQREIELNRAAAGRPKPVVNPVPAKNNIEKSASKLIAARRDNKNFIRREKTGYIVVRDGVREFEIPHKQVKIEHDLEAFIKKLNDNEPVSLQWERYRADVSELMLKNDLAKTKAVLKKPKPTRKVHVRPSKTKLTSEKGEAYFGDIEPKMTPQERSAMEDLIRLKGGKDKSAAVHAESELGKIEKQVRKRLGEKGEVPNPFQSKKPLPEQKGGPKGESPVARRARERVEAAKAAKQGAPTAETATLGSIVDKSGPAVRIRRTKKNGRGQEDVDITGDIEIELPTLVKTQDSAGRDITKIVGGTKVGNTNVGKLLQDGEITERQAKILVAAQKANPIIGEKFMQTTRAERIAAIGDPSVKKLLEVIENVPPKHLAALHDTPVSQALAIAKRAIDQGVPITHVIDDISQDLLVARKVAYLLGQNLQAIRRSAARGELTEILERHLKKPGLTKAEEQGIREALKQLGSPKAKTRFMRTMDMVTEYGINAMLSSPVTFVRNLAGSAAGVASQVPAKIGQATASNIAALLKIPQTERVYFREVGPEIAGIVQGFVRGFRKGKRFLEHEDIKRVFEHVEKRIQTVAATKIPKGQAFSQLKRDQKARILRELRDDLRDLMTEEEVTRAAELGFTSPTRSIPGKLGEVINIPVRGLVATDKVFQTASASGHVAARRIRKAIQEKKPVRDIRLTPDEIEEAKNDAMFYVFREKLGPKLGALQNLISETPLMPLIIPFLKSRINFVKFALKNSPFGFIDTLRKSVAAGAIDTKSAGRAISGTAIIMGVKAFFDKNADTIELHPAASNQAEREIRRESGIGEQVIVFGRNLKDPKKREITHVEPYANLAPFSGPLEALALIQEYYRRKARGGRVDEAFAKTFNKALRGVLNDSAFGSVKDAVQAAESMADQTVALGKDGKPEKSFLESLGTGKGAQVVSRKIAGTFIPNIIADVQRLTDDRIIDARSLDEHLSARLPGLSKGIKARQTVFGTDATRQQKRLPFNPFFKDKPIDPAMSEMVRLEIFPAKPPTQLSEQKLKIVLTDDEQRRFNFLGKELKTVLDTVVEQPWYRESEDFVQAEILEAMINNFREVQGKVIKTEGLLRLIQSEEGIRQMLEGITKGRPFSPFQPNE